MEMQLLSGHGGRTSPPAPAESIPQQAVDYTGEHNAVTGISAAHSTSCLLDRIEQRGVSAAFLNQLTASQLTNDMSRAASADAVAFLKKKIAEVEAEIQQELSAMSVQSMEHEPVVGLTTKCRPRSCGGFAEWGRA